MTSEGRRSSVNNSHLLISCCHFFAAFPVPLEHLEESDVIWSFELQPAQAKRELGFFKA